MSVELRRITPADDPGVALVIRTVMPEFGANGPGFAIQDPEVDSMCASYSGMRCSFYVLIENSQVVGCGGVAPVSGGGELVCELRKMYFLPHLRGLGLGQKLLDLCLGDAKKFGFSQCYIETLGGMTSARKLYERNGFERLDEPMGSTGHFSCDTFYLKTL